MKFRGLRSVVVERDAKNRAKRREIVVESVFARCDEAAFARGMATDARPLWCLLAYAHSGEAQVPANISARVAANAALLAAN